MRTLSRAWNPRDIPEAEYAENRGFMYGMAFMGMIPVAGLVIAVASLLYFLWRDNEYNIANRAYQVFLVSIMVHYIYSQIGVLH